MTVRSGRDPRIFRISLSLSLEHWCILLKAHSCGLVREGGLTTHPAITQINNYLTELMINFLTRTTYLLSLKIKRQSFQVYHFVIILGSIYQSRSNKHFLIILYWVSNY